MKVRRDAFRELLVSWTISMIFVYFVPRPEELLFHGGISSSR